MRALAARELLDIWERGHHAAPWQQALLLLTAACPESSREELARLSVDRRDSMLSRLREWTFGSRFACMVNCPACGEVLEFAFGADAIGAGTRDRPAAMEFQAEGYRVVFRLPNTEDLAALSGLPDLKAARSSLIERCLLQVAVAGADDAPDGKSGEPLPALPPSLQEAIVQQMGTAARQADLRIDLTCPACDHNWDGCFDIVSFFWSEIDDWARRTLREIHILAAAYGWSEREILDIGAWRRRIYLEMVQA